MRLQSLKRIFSGWLTTIGIVLASGIGALSVNAMGAAQLSHIRDTVPVVGASGISSSPAPSISRDLGAGIVLYGSPTIADVTGDSKQEIVVVTDDGKVHLVSFTGSSLVVLWTKSTSTYFGSATTIRSVPVVADLDNNGSREIVISVGDVVESGENGGVIVLNGSNGSVPSGWPRQTTSYYPPHPATDGIVGSPAVGDLDGDGDLEIVAGALDRKVYAWHHDGSAVSGFPITLIHTVWSTPALADLDKDGRLEIILNTDVGKYVGDDGWTCPFATPYGNYCGGSLWVFRHDGSPFPGFPVYTYEMMQSSPAVVDLDGDGWLDIISGTGTFYSTYSGSMYANHVYAWDRNGNSLPGWPVTTNAQMPGSPVIGDIAGDGGLEVVAPGKDGRLYAWNANGSVVSGFPMTPLDSFNGDPIPTGIGFDIGNGIALADFDNNGKQDIFMRVNWYVTIVNGSGQHLTATSWQASDTRPAYQTDNGGVTTPAVGDIDNDGNLELVTVGTKYVSSPPYNDGNAYVYVWNLSSAGSAFWGTMHRNPRNTRLIARLTGAPSAVTLLHPYGDPGSEAGTVHLYTDGVHTTWSVLSKPGNVTIAPGSGSLPGVQSIPFTVATTSYMTGTHSIGTVTLQAQIVDELYGPNTVSVPVTLIVGDVKRVYLPSVQKGY